MGMKNGKWVHEPARIEQTGGGLSEETMRRLDRMRAVLGASRSKVWEMALTHAGGLSGLEDVYAEGVAEFNEAARRARRTWQDYAHWYAVTFSKRTPEQIKTLPARRARTRRKHVRMGRELSDGGFLVFTPEDAPTIRQVLAGAGFNLGAVQKWEDFDE